MPNGRNGAVGLNVRPLAVLGPNLGPEHAVNQLLEATNSVLEITQRLNNARHPNVQVVSCETSIWWLHKFSPDQTLSTKATQATGIISLRIHNWILVTHMNIEIRAFLKEIIILQKVSKYVSHHRCFDIAKLPWRLSKQLWQNTKNTSWSRISCILRIHCVQCRIQFHMWLWPPDNCGRGRDNLDGKEVRHHPAAWHHKQERHGGGEVPHGWHRCKGWVESQLDPCGARFGSCQ